MKLHGGHSYVEDQAGRRCWVVGALLKESRDLPPGPVAFSRLGSLLVEE